MRQQLKHRLSSLMAFSLIELVMVMTLSGILMTAVGEIIRHAVDNSQQQYELDYLVGQQKFAMQRISRDLQQIRSNQADDLILATADDIRFIDQAGNVIEYRLLAGSLQLNGWDLAHHISTFDLSYYDADGDLTNNIDDVRYVNITIAVQQHGMSFSTTTTVFLRNVE